MGKGVFQTAILLSAATSFATWPGTAFANGAQECQASGGRGDLSAGTCVCAQTGGGMQTVAERNLCLKETAGEIGRTLDNLNSKSQQPRSCTSSSLVYNTNLQCPKQLLQQITLSNDRSSLFGLIGSPDSMCSSLIDHQFATAADLEKYLSSSSYSVGAGPTLLSSSCLADFSDFSVAGHPNPLDSTDAKQAVATYYNLMNRVNNGAVSTLESIASIDSLLGHPLLNGVSCSDPRLTAEASYCAGIARQHCQPQNGLDAMSAETLDAIENIQLISSKISGIEANPESSTATGMGAARVLSDSQAQQIAQYQQAIQAIENLYPWVKGEEFEKYLKQHGTAIDSTGKQPANLQQIVHDATYSQLLQNRAAAVQQLGNLGRAGQCLNMQYFDYNMCKDFDDIIGTTPPLPGLQIRQTTAAGAESADQLSNVDCRWQIAQTRDKANGVIANTAIGIGLTIATAGISSMGMAARAGLALMKSGGTALDAAKAADLAAQAAAASEILAGTNVAFAAVGLKQVGSACIGTLSKLDQGVMSLPVSPQGDSCPAAPGAGANVVVDQSRSCAMAVAMAAVNLLPLATPALMKIAHAVAPPAGTATDVTLTSARTIPHISHPPLDLGTEDTDHPIAVTHLPPAGVGTNAGQKVANSLAHSESFTQLDQQLAPLGYTRKTDILTSGTVEYGNGKGSTLYFENYGKSTRPLDAASQAKLTQAINKGGNYVDPGSVAMRAGVKVAPPSVAAANNAYAKNLERQFQARSDSTLQQVQAANAAGKPIVFDVIGVGGGPHDAVLFAGVKEANPSAKTLVLEGSDSAGTFAKLGNTFRLNTSEYQHLSGNTFAGSPVQVRDFNGQGSRFVRAGDVGSATLGTYDFSDTPIVFNQRVTSIKRIESGVPAKFELTTSSGTHYYANGISIATGLGDPVMRVTDPATRALIQSESAQGPFAGIQTVDDFLKNLNKASSTAPATVPDLRNETVAVIGAGDGGNIAVEAAGGLAKDLPAGVNAKLGAGKIVWIGQDAKTDDQFVSSLNARKQPRYSDIGELYANNTIDPVPGRLQTIQKVTSADGKTQYLLTYADSAGNKSQVTVDRVIFSTGYQSGASPLLSDLGGETTIQPVTAPGSATHLGDRVSVNGQPQNIWIVGNASGVTPSKETWDNSVGGYMDILMPRSSQVGEQIGRQIATRDSGPVATHVLGSGTNKSSYILKVPSVASASSTVAPVEAKVTLAKLLRNDGLKFSPGATIRMGFYMNGDHSLNLTVVGLNAKSSSYLAGLLRNDPTFESEVQGLMRNMKTKRVLVGLPVCPDGNPDYTNLWLTAGKAVPQK